MVMYDALYALVPLLPGRDAQLAAGRVLTCHAESISDACYRPGLYVGRRRSHAACSPRRQGRYR